MNNVTNTQQEVQQKLVKDHVITTLTSIVNYILVSDPGNAPYTLFTREDIKNATVNVCSVCEEDVPQHGSCDKCGRKTEVQEQYRNILEWHKVTSWLLEQLILEGEAVIEEECLWGRCQSGQSVYMDSVIHRICKNNNLY